MNTLNSFPVLLFSLYIALLGTGCTHTTSIRTDITPAAFTSQKSNESIGLYIEPRLMQYVESVRPSTTEMAAHTYSFKVGPALHSALHKSVLVAYANVDLLEEPSPVRAYAKIIRISLTSSNVRVQFLASGLSTVAKADAILSVQIELLEGVNLKPLRRATISGQGLSTQPAGFFGQDAAAHFSKAIEDAVRQISENASILLMAPANS
jgi:hypothetical protein